MSVRESFLSGQTQECQTENRSASSFGTWRSRRLWNLGKAPIRSDWEARYCFFSNVASFRVSKQVESVEPWSKGRKLWDAHHVPTEGFNLNDISACKCVKQTSWKTKDHRWHPMFEAAIGAVLWITDAIVCPWLLVASAKQVQAPFKHESKAPLTTFEISFDQFHAVCFSSWQVCTFVNESGKHVYFGIVSFTSSPKVRDYILLGEWCCLSVVTGGNNICEWPASIRLWTSLNQSQLLTFFDNHELQWSCTMKSSCTMKK